MARKPGEPPGQFPNLEGRPRKKPRITDEGVAERLAERLAAGETITRIIADQDMPALCEFYDEMDSNTQFRKMITRARERGQDTEVERMKDIAEAATPLDYKVVELRIKTAQWRAQKIYGKKYGDKVQLEHSGREGGPIQTIEGKLNTKDAADLYKRAVDGEK